MISGRACPLCLFFYFKYIIYVNLLFQMFFFIKKLYSFELIGVEFWSHWVRSMWNCFSKLYQFTLPTAGHEGFWHSFLTNLWLYQPFKAQLFWWVYRNNLPWHYWLLWGLAPLSVYMPFVIPVCYNACLRLEHIWGGEIYLSLFLLLF